MLYRLVIHHRPGPEVVRVFLPVAPQTVGPEGTPVVLRALPPPAGRRLLGRDVRDRRSYREFRSEVELLLAGYEPAGSHRVCESWAEYLDPWRSPAMNDRPTERVEQIDEAEAVAGG